MSRILSLRLIHAMHALTSRFTAVLHRYKLNMNFKTIITLLDIGLERCFVKFSFILRGCFWQ